MHRNILVYLVQPRERSLQWASILRVWWEKTPNFSRHPYSWWGNKVILKQRAASWVDLMLVRGTVAFGMQLLLSDSFAAQKVLDLFC